MELDNQLDSLKASLTANTSRPSLKEMEEMRKRRHQNPKPRREGKWWYLRVWGDGFKNGKKVRILKRIKLARVEDKKFREVQKIADEIVRPVNQGLVSIGTAINFSDYIKSTYIPSVLPWRQPAVQVCYKGAVRKYLEPAFGKSALSEITPLTVRAFFAEMLTRDVPHPTMAKTRDVLSHVMNSAVEGGLITANPVKGFRIKDTREKKDKSFIYPIQFQALVEIMPEPYATMVYTAVWTGLRVSELCGLQWRDIGVDSIRVARKYCRGKEGATKTAASQATISVDSEVIARIQRLKELTVEVRAGRAIRKHKLVKRSEPESLVFQSVKDGKHMRDGNILRRFIKPTAEKLKLGGVNWRCLRTSCATWMVQAGADPKSVQGQMRHSRITTTMEIYAQFVPEGQRRAVAQMAEYARKSVLESGTDAGMLSVQ